MISTTPVQGDWRPAGPAFEQQQPLRQHHDLKKRGTGPTWKQSTTGRGCSEGGLSSLATVASLLPGLGSRGLDKAPGSGHSIKARTGGDSLVRGTPKKKKKPQTHLFTFMPQHHRAAPPVVYLDPMTCVPYPFPPSIPPPHVMHLVHPPPMMPFALEHQHPLREPLLPLRSLPEEITWGFHKARGQMDLQTKTPPPARPKRNAASSPPAECRGRAKRARFSRKGKWSEEEEQFANLLASNFKKGLIDVPEGVTLRFFIASQLGCDPMRVSKKFHGLESLGKLVFRADEFKNVTPEAKQKAAEEIAMAEARFLDRLRLDTDPQDQSTDESETKDGESKHLPLVKLWSRAIIKDTRDSATAIDWDLSDVLRRGSFEREVVVRSARAGSVSPKR